jgi:hypothetical protein
MHTRCSALSIHLRVHLSTVAAATGYNVVHPGDVSLMTYRGHAVLQTLINACECRW